MASAALLAYSGRPVRAQTISPAGCTPINVAVVSCSGDLSDGVIVDNGSGPSATHYTVLNVQNLATNITPLSGTDGVSFSSYDSVQLNIHPGPFAIVTTDAFGILGASVAGDVTITSSADITTSGNNAYGIAGSLQDGALIITSAGEIKTSGNYAHGILATTIGSPGTDYGSITIQSTSNIVTTGDNAAGIDAGSTNAPINITSFGSIEVSGVDSIGIRATSEGAVAIDSFGSVTAGQDSTIAIAGISIYSSVSIKSFGDLSTSGQYGVGIYARAGDTAKVFSYGSITTIGNDAAGIAAAGANGVDILATGDIKTSGMFAPGIAAYSDGNIRVVATGKITTTGPSSDGIYAVSTSGMVTVISSGDIAATGTNSAGIYADGYAGTVVTNFGHVTGGACCAGVMQTSANENLLMNFGTITAGLADFAINNFGYSNRVDNFGTITGDVLLTDAGGGSTFVNHAGALFNSGVNVTVGTLINAGTLAPGGRGNVGLTIVEDDLVQTPTGVLAIDIDPALGEVSDLLIASNTAVLAGTVVINVLSLPPPNTPQDFVILQGLTSLTSNGLLLSASPALHPSLVFSSNQVDLLTSVDFSTSELNGNQLAIAQNLQGAFLAGGGGLAPVLLGLLNTQGIEAYEQALNELSPELYSDAQIAALYASLAFSNSLLSCKVNGADTAAIIREGQCLWAGASAVFLDTGTTSSQIGFNTTAGLFSAGAQVALDSVWRLGFAGGYQSSVINTATNAQTEGELAQAGVALKYNPGPLLLAGTLTGGHGWYDTQRPMAFGGFAAVPRSSAGLDLFSLGARAAYVFGSPDFYLKPVLDLAATRLDLGGFDESGGGAANLGVEGSGQTVLTAAPAIETGTEWWLGNGTLVRPYLRGGVSFYGNSDLALTASFLAAPAGVGPFTIETKMDDVMGVVGAGIDVINDGDAVLHFGYDGQLGETTQIHSVSLKGSAKF